ncbi:Cof-type HAD-IIB family hydrolase [Sphingobacteriaceae bacterium WQ 2009]|uniref:Cof-type HAD-IIB family hydrolase n=1 Tax=Rhinopithecimicrobium faecis TaxID=2820698 RepID=A0A8T4HAY4_9SPHI|nr:Cof-type HAD-IIB family hydrolase [Sphingobacteriaceae bacterium WQ 2009]
MIKAVFFDIDGTLISFDTHRVPPSTEQAIAALKAKGIKVIISTGRSINSINHITHLGFDGYITFNGGYCVTKEGDILFKKTIAQSDIDALIKHHQEVEPIGFSFMSEKQISINTVNPAISEMYALLNLEVPQLIDYDNFDSASVLQTNVFVDPAKEHTLMPAIMPNSIATRWSPLFADVNPAGQSKKVGIDIFLNHFGIDRSETMSFGDGGNDITMLQHTEIGVAMGNANQEVKEIADYVTESVDDDGIWKALKHFQVI